MMNLRHLTARVRADERGTTMTEFLITLPIFVFMFIAIMRLGLVESHSVIVDSRAYQAAWDAAIPVSKQPLHVVHAIPAAAGVHAIGQLGNTHTTTTLQKVFVLGEETAAYSAGLALNGTMGESYMRVKPVDPFVDLLDLENRVEMSWNSDLIGNSKYVKDLMDEKLDFNISGGGALAILNSVLSATGTRPAIAAGARYGMVSGVETDSSNWVGWNVNYKAHFTTAVAPYPMGTFGRELITTAVVRLTMESHVPYKEVLGIAWSQPLQGKSLNVPDLKPVFWAPCKASNCDAGGP